MSDENDLAARIDAIERGYEYLLAYAAQGRQDDKGSDVRQTLTSMFAALDGLSDLLAAAVRSSSEAAARDAAGFLEAIESDARKARGAIGLVLSRPAISSLLVDNLNASIHLRALLTDVFLAEQALK
ncbi:MAG: hypothetical protein IRZ28_20495 [Steroidobacteraceae bacterium]|nr:hypothetical protein [Steroidobacteraceae bacterium]